MIGIILTSHGELAKGLLETTKLFLGEFRTDRGRMPATTG